MSGCSSTASTAILSPWTTLKTPSGTPASFNSSAVQIDADGSFSDGLRTKVLPQASAGAHIHMGTMTGKLNGVIPATTPSGGRIEETSGPVDACSQKSLLRSVGRPQQSSVTSAPSV